QFLEVSDTKLDQVLKLNKSLRPELGLQYTTAFLRYYGLKVQWLHVQNSLEHVDGLGCTLRHQDAILCCKYESCCSGAISHIDGIQGNHKLIKWGIVLIDRYDHVVTSSHFVLQHIFIYIR
ncbi:hypothetical protein JB92DRAFT_2767834, partial [Gautieria morchelliformis]